MDDILDAVESELSGYEAGRQLGFNDGYKKGFDDGLEAARPLAAMGRTPVDNKLELFITDLLADLEDDITAEMQAFAARITEILKKAISQWVNY
jgi:flagellar biosynthesis/type III secretory pathway protein FliH